MYKKVKTALIGCGGMGNHHLKSYVGENREKFEIVALCDIRPEKAEAARKAFDLDCKIYTDYNDILKIPDLDAVDIATPNYLHSVIAIAALNAGKNVFSEKPDCITVRQAEDMKAAAEKSGKVLMVMRNNRYYEGSVFLKQYIAEGKMGDIYAGRCGWQRRRGIPGKGGWFTTKAQSGGGPLIDLGVHMIDLSIWFMGNPKPVSVFGCTYRKFADNEAQSDSVNSQFGEAKEEGIFDVEDLAMGFIRFDNGACLQIEFSWASNVEAERQYVELRGTKAGFTWTNSGSSVTVYGESGGKLFDMSPKLYDTDGHGKNIAHFADVVNGIAAPDFVPEQGLNMIKLINAMYKSAETGHEVIL